MSTLEEVTQTVTDLTTALNAANVSLDNIDTKLDEIRAFIEGLQGGGVVTQEQLDTLATMLSSAKDSATTAQTKAEAALTEADALDSGE